MNLAGQVTQLIKEALIEELEATPKPGLVDLEGSGAHSDMNARSFYDSTDAIAPYLGQIFEMALDWTGEPDAILDAIRPIGIAAENAMLTATCEVNTHKGAIFTLGLLCASAGLCKQKTGAFSISEILSICKSICERPLAKELQSITTRLPRSYGEQLYISKGIAGIRGEALAGFPSISDTALPSLKNQSQPNKNSLLLFTLFNLMTVVEDSTVIHRAGIEGLEWMQVCSRKFIDRHPVFDEEAIQELRSLNLEFMKRNISPGGCADLLSAALFLLKLEN